MAGGRFNGTTAQLTGRKRKMWLSTFREKPQGTQSKDEFILPYLAWHSCRGNNLTGLTGTNPFGELSMLSHHMRSFMGCHSNKYYLYRL